MNCYNIWYVYKFFIWQICIKGYLVANEFGDTFWGELKTDALKGGGGCKQKGKDYTIFSLSNS